MRRALIAGPLALTVASAVAAPIAAPIAAAASSASSSVCVEVVVDYGALNDNNTSATCVVVPTGSTGASVLEARAKKLGVPPPRYRADGLLCAIDGLPKAPECAERTSDGGYRYWSYWHKQGDGSWTYAQSGPFDYTVTGSHPGEGWSWVEGQEQNSRPPARVSYTRVCPAGTASPAPRPPATHTPGGTSAPGTGAGSTGGTPQQHTAPSAGGASASTGAAGAAARSAVPSRPDPTPSGTPSEVPIAAPARQEGGSNAALPGLLGGVTIVAVLGAAAWWRARRTAQP